MMAFHAARLADQIIEALLGGQLAPGTRLDRNALAAWLDPSPETLDMALAQVCAQGLARRHPEHGVEVLAPHPAALVDRFEALGEIQALCASLAARRARSSDLRALEDLVTQLEDAEPGACRQMTLDLHDRICRMSRNAELARMAADLRRQMAASGPQAMNHPDRWRQWIEEQRALVEAICERNEGLAATIMRGHLRAAAREVLFLTRARPG